MVPRVTVIVPFYNSEKTLQACLDSIGAQSLDNIEVVLVDDGSTDGSLEIARSYAEVHKDNCIILSQANAGPAAARNKGLSHASGDYVAFVDSDDTIAPTMYEKMIESADQYDSDIVSCGRAAIDAATGDVIKCRIPQYDVLRGTIVECPAIVRRVGPLMCDKIFRRAIIEDHGIRFDEDVWYAEDFLFGSRVKLWVHCVSAVREDLYFYFMGNEASLTGGSTHILDIPKACERVVDLYQENEVLEAVANDLLYVLAGFYLRKCDAFPGSSDLLRSFKDLFRGFASARFGLKWSKVVLKRVVKGTWRSPRPLLLLKAFL